MPSNQEPDYIAMLIELADLPREQRQEKLASILFTRCGFGDQEDYDWATDTAQKILGP